MTLYVNLAELLARVSNRAFIALVIVCRRCGR